MSSEPKGGWKEPRSTWILEAQSRPPIGLSGSRGWLRGARTGDDLAEAGVRQTLPPLIREAGPTPVLETACSKVTASLPAGWTLSRDTTASVAGGAGCSDLPWAATRA
jgi:hypothetical protein